jgi:hypothetical protein
MRQEYVKLLQEMSKTPYGKALQAFLDEEFDKLNDVQSCKDWEDVRGRQHALKTLEGLFRFMTTKDTSDKPKNQYM